MRRKTTQAVEEKRKLVKIRLIDRKHAGKVVEVYRLMEELIADHHSGEVDGVLRNIDRAKVLLAWRDGLKPDVDKVLILGSIRKATETDKYVLGADCDFVIGLNAEAWPKLSAERQRLVMDHQLYHAAPDVDRNGNQKIDSREWLCWRLRKDGVQEHREMLDRYGAKVCLGMNEAGLKAAEDADRPLLGALEQMGVGADSDVPAWRISDIAALQQHNVKITDHHLEKLRDAGLPTLGPLADRMENMGTDWSKGFRFRDEIRRVIEDALAVIRAAADDNGGFGGDPAE